MGYHKQISKWNTDGGQKSFILGMSGTQYVALLTKLLSLFCVAYLVEFFG